ncbi:MAG UNVERIFIED_CONTAM: hypothetical protein LVT10_12035 [Anaerolineae bacterium]
MNGLVDDLLTAGELQAQRQLDIHLDATNLVEVIHRAVRSPIHTIQHSSVLLVTSPLDSATVQADQVADFGR